MIRRRFSRSVLPAVAALTLISTGCSPFDLLDAGPEPTISEAELADEQAVARLVDSSWTPDGQIKKVFAALKKHDADCALQRWNTDYQEYVCQAASGEVIHELTFRTNHQGEVLVVNGDMTDSATQDRSKVAAGGREIVQDIADVLTPGQGATAAELFATPDTKGFRVDRQVDDWAWNGSVEFHTETNYRFDPKFSAVRAQPPVTNKLRGPSPVGVSNDDIKKWGESQPEGKCYSSPRYGREDCYVGEDENFVAVSTWGALDSVVDMVWYGEASALPQRTGGLTFLREPWRTQVPQWVAQQSGITGLTVIDGAVVRWTTGPGKHGLSHRVTIGHRADEG